MYGRSDGELWFHPWHMWPVPSSSTPSVAVPSNSFVFIDTNSFSKDGRKINVGDCALFQALHSSLPFVGLIRKLIVGKENSLSLSVNWLYRPSDIKLKEGALLQAAPNEIFYSFHKDEIPAASIFHPCKVTFLPKGVELPSGLSSFICRRVYDIENERLCWLTDKNYLNSYLIQERQVEVNQLLDKTRVDMYGALQTGGRSPKPLNGTPQPQSQPKPSSDNVQNSSSSISSHAKSKKREHGVHNSESVKRERLSKVDDADSGQLRPEHVIKTEIAKITDKGGLVDFGGVEKLIQLMRPESAEKKLDLPSRTLLVDVISVTDRFDCLGRFVQLRGLSVLDEWLQEIHKGKIGDGSPKVKDKSVEEFLFFLLRALDRLPVNLHALQTCNVGKSVNHLRSHKNSEIQNKAKSLVNTWKRRVEAEMNIIETKSGTSRGGSWPNTGSRRVGGPSEVGPKSPTSQPSPVKAQQPKHGSGETVAKSPTSTSPGSIKLPDMPSSANKDGRSCSSSQSPNNSQSCSSDHVRLPNTNRSPTRTVSVESPENVLTTSGKDSLPEASEKQEEKVNGETDNSVQVDNVPNTGTSSSVVTPKSGKLYEASYSSINALVESCAKFSEAPSVGDDVGMNLLASVAAGEMSRSDVSPVGSSGNNSQLPEDTCSVNVAKINVNGHSVDSQQVPPVGAHISKCEDNPQYSKENAEDIKGGGCEECCDDKSIKINVVKPDAAATSVKAETQIDEDEKKLVNKWPNNNNLGTTSFGDVDLKPKSEEPDDEKERENMDSGPSVCHRSNQNIEKAPGSAKQEVRSSEECGDVAETSVKLDFDLNEVCPGDDGIQGEVERSFVHTPNLLPSMDSPVNGNRPALVTVASAAKGPFYPPENLSRGKRELGWKGSAATSAFRPAEPRKVARPLFDFDLNVGVPEDGSGLDVDLNASEEVVQLSVGRPTQPHIFNMPNSSRGFDLNGPGVEEGGEAVSFSKNGIGVQFMPGVVPNVRMNMGNWFPPNNTYQPITIPQNYPSSLNPEMLRGPVLSSSPAVNFPPTVPFQYSTFPFETNFSIPMDSSSSGGPICFPNIPSQAQLVGPNGVVSMPYIMSLPAGGSSPDGRKWSSQGLDLNVKGGTDEKLGLRQQIPTAEQQLKMFQQMAMKRKEADGDRISYKHPQWQ